MTWSLVPHIEANGFDAMPFPGIKHWPAESFRFPWSRERGRIARLAGCTVRSCVNAWIRQRPSEAAGFSASRLPMNVRIGKRP
jgi:hypothetical protein